MEIFKRLICVFQAILLMLIGTAEEAIRYAEPFYNAESRQSGDNSLPDRGAALDEEAITGGGAEPADNARLGEGAEPEKYAGSGGDAASGADAVYSIAAAPRIPAVI
ncbi:MAG: hypothetical protein FWH57_13115, partial [Oscillospiraceae bacterium]|nr:hypothetical protein [Oscillospiraceae bacterium]